MPRKLQSAAISFGLVTIPVNLYTAVSEHDVHFHQIHAVCGSRIKQQLYCPVCERVVERDELVKGYEVAKGEYVRVTADELEQLEASASQSIDIVQFVPLTSVDPIYFEDTYYLGPDKRGEKPYKLLTQAMEKSQRVAVAKYVMRGKENLVLVRPARGGLVLHRMYYADEVRDFNEIERGAAATTEQELDLALRLIEELSEPEFHPELFRDEYRERVLDMINEKAEGKQVTIQPAERRAPVVDLMEALRASLEKGEKTPKKPAPLPARGERIGAKRAQAGRK
ncbi:non-homologous end joining protein Ku [Candidatus Nitrospira bockiana]